MHPRPSDLAALVRILPSGAVVLCVDAETCAAPGGDARNPQSARVVELGLVAFSGDPLPGGIGDPVEAATSCDLASLGDLDAADGTEIVGYLHADSTRVNPGCRIDADSAQVHKISDAAVRDAPSMMELADLLRDWLVPDPLRPLYITGYNVARYDVPLLAVELTRVGRMDVADLLRAVPVLDVMLVRRAAEQPYTLRGTLLRYGLGELDGAHGAGADSLGTLAGLAAQAACGDLSDPVAAAALVTPKGPAPGSVDAEGKLQWAKGAAPTPPTPTPDNVTITFGKKAKGKTLRQAGADYCKWICGSDFPDDVKTAIKTAFGAAAVRW